MMGFRERLATNTYREIAESARKCVGCDEPEPIVQSVTILWSLMAGGSTKGLLRALGYNRQFTYQVISRYVSQGYIKRNAWHTSNWLDSESGQIALILDGMVGAGIIVRIDEAMKEESEIQKIST